MSKPQPTSAEQDRAHLSSLQGTKLGRWQLERLILSDALGAVYRVSGEHPRGQQYALRLLPAAVLHAADPTLSQALWDDLEAVAKAQSPSVVEVLEAGPSLGGQPLPYVLQPWVEGKTLDSILAERGDLHADEAIPLARLILDGCSALSAANTIHGSLHPARILIERSEAGPRRVRLCDAGLSRVFEAHAQASGAGLLEGCAAAVASHAAYLCPQQAHTGRATPLTDIYSVGTILYQLLAGHPPFESATPGTTLRRQMVEVPVSLALLPDPPLLPDGLQDILEIAFGKQPEERLQSPVAFRNALASLLEPCDQELQGFLPDDVLSAPTPSLALSLQETLAIDDAPFLSPSPTNGKDHKDHKDHKDPEPPPSRFDSSPEHELDPDLLLPTPPTSPKPPQTANATPPPQAPTTPPQNAKDANQIKDVNLDDDNFEGDWFGNKQREARVSYQALSLVGDEEAYRSQNRTVRIIFVILALGVAGLVYWILTMQPDDPDAARRAAEAAEEEAEKTRKIAAAKPIIADLEAKIAAKAFTGDQQSADILVRQLSQYVPVALTPAQYNQYLETIATHLRTLANDAEAPFQAPQQFVRHEALKTLHKSLLDPINQRVRQLDPATITAKQRASILSLNGLMSGQWTNIQMGCTAHYYTTKTHKQNLEAIDNAIHYWAAIAALPSLPSGPANEHIKRLRTQGADTDKEIPVVVPRWRFVGLPQPLPEDKENQGDPTTDPTTDPTADPTDDPTDGTDNE